jgi:hypothetical protein
MNYDELNLDLAPLIQADRLFEAERHRCIQKALAGCQKRSRQPVPNLRHLVRRLTAWKQHVAPKPAS